ncbi:MAG: class I SAM-dependent methyltransferase [Desulfamplus sp.]|nr:class I SAM-dependent methyltransferase [Desulfamplus sp.]
MMIDFELSKNIKGFMADDEALRLYETALKASLMGPCLEIGSYCGKSAYFLGLGCRENGAVVYSIDHHRGSEEQQPDQEYFDPELYDPSTGKIDTLPFFRNTIEKAGLVENIVPIVAPSRVAGRMWSTPLSLVFIDGGHSLESAMEDYDTWSGHIMENGFLLIHDIFMDPAQGGQAPRKVYERALDSGYYESLGMTGTLGVLSRKWTMVKN